MWSARALRWTAALGGRGEEVPGSGAVTSSWPTESPPDAQGWAERADRLHEVRASMAGVSAAIRLLAEGKPVGGGTQLVHEHRQRLAEMLGSEIDRLQRLVTEGPDLEVARFTVDELVEPVVTSRRAAGQAIGWTPCGHQVLAARDAVSEAVNILLVNAARHAPGAPVRIAAHDTPDHVRIEVCDEGPGVPDRLRRGLFQPGVRDETSTGQGLGLGLARRLLASSGGTLELLDRPPAAGAGFALTLPACPRPDGDEAGP